MAGPVGQTGSRGGTRIDRGRPGSSAYVLALLLPTLLLVAGLSAAQDVPGSLTSHGPVLMSGSGDATGPQGHLYLPSATAVESVQLSAETIVATVQWERGVRIGDPSRPVHTKADHGEEQEVVRDVAIAFDPDGKRAELLTYRTEAGSAARVGGFGYGEGDYIDDRVVTYAGVSGDTQQAGEVERPRFVYEIDEPTVWFDTTGQGQVNGSFSVFVNNLTLEAEEGDGSTWSTWAGYREEEPGAPTTTYERRVVTLKVTKGTLTTAPRAPVVLFGPQVDVELAGVAALDDVSGRLNLGEEVVFYEHSRVALDGQLDLELVATDGAGDTAAGALEVLPGGQFRAIETDEDGHRTVVVPSSGSGIGSGALVLGLLAAVGVGVVVKGVAGRAAAGLGEWRFEQAMGEGKAAMDAHDWEAAVVAHEKATRVKPESSVAWSFLGISLLETGRFEECLEIIEDAETAPGMDPWDVMHLEAAAAWGAGKYAWAARVLEQMANQHPEVTQDIVDDLGIDLEEVAPEVGRMLARREPPGGLDGYV